MERKSTQPGEMPPPGMDAERAVRQERRRAYERAAKARRAQRWAKLNAELAEIAARLRGERH